MTTDITFKIFNQIALWPGIPAIAGPGSDDWDR